MLKLIELLYKNKLFIKEEEMTIDLENIRLFQDSSIIFNNIINFIYEKNGTGKSTLTHLIKKQMFEKYDVIIFQGFEKLIGSNGKLNAMLLDEKNNDINQKIKIKEKKIRRN